MSGYEASEPRSPDTSLFQAKQVFARGRLRSVEGADTLDSSEANKLDSGSS